MTIIDDTGRERIAFRSTRGEGVFAKDRWTELAVYYLPHPGLGGHHFIAEVTGRSTRKGEKDRVTSKASRALEAALEIFMRDGRAISIPAGHVMQEARTWAEQHCLADGYPDSQPTYTDAQRTEAALFLHRSGLPAHIDPDRMVDELAELLGLRRAGA